MLFDCACGELHKKTPNGWKRTSRNIAIHKSFLCSLVREILNFLSSGRVTLYVDYSLVRLCEKSINSYKDFYIFLNHQRNEKFFLGAFSTFNSGILVFLSCRRKKMYIDCSFMGIYQKKSLKKQKSFIISRCTKK